jgi:hypothetical protein
MLANIDLVDRWIHFGCFLRPSGLMFRTRWFSTAGVFFAPLQFSVGLISVAVVWSIR